MKILKRIIVTIIRQQVDIDSIQFGFMSRRSITDVIFLYSQTNARKTSLETK